MDFVSPPFTSRHMKNIQSQGKYSFEGEKLDDT